MWMRGLRKGDVAVWATRDDPCFRNGKKYSLATLISSGIFVAALVCANESYCDSLAPDPSW